MLNVLDHVVLGLLHSLNHRCWMMYRLLDHILLTNEKLTRKEQLPEM